jgi:hypothetical protein
MATLQLTEEEREALETVLKGFLSDMSYEIADTDLSKFRDELRARRQVLFGIVEKLGSAGD